MPHTVSTRCLPPGTWTPLPSASSPQPRNVLRKQCCPHTHFTRLLTVRVERHLLHRQLPARVSIVAEINFPKSSSAKQLPQPPVHRCLQGYKREERAEGKVHQGDLSIRVHLTLQSAPSSPGQAGSPPLPGAPRQTSFNFTSATGVGGGCLPVCTSIQQKQVPEKLHFFKSPSSKNCSLSQRWTLSPLL